MLFAVRRAVNESLFIGSPFIDEIGVVIDSLGEEIPDGFNIINRHLIKGKMKSLGHFFRL
jgi:hypothetical protein